MVADIQVVAVHGMVMVEALVAVHGVTVVVAVHGAVVEEAEMAVRQEQAVAVVVVEEVEAVTEDNNLLSPLMLIYVILIP
jgi:hypothetical protein